MISSAIPVSISLWVSFKFKKSGKAKILYGSLEIDVLAEVHLTYQQNLEFELQFLHYVVPKHISSAKHFSLHNVVTCLVVLIDTFGYFIQHATNNSKVLVPQLTKQFVR